MATVRGNVILATVAFIEDRFGREAHEGVMGRLSPECARTFLTTARESQRGPLEHVFAYMQVAHELLAPGDEDFFRQMGSFGGQIHRDRSAYGVMVADRETGARMAPTVWRSFFDEGELEIARQEASLLVLRVTGFTSRASFCQRILGSAAALFRASKAEHTACVLRGDAWCDFTLSW